MRNIAYITDIHLDESYPKEQGVDARSNWKQILNDVAGRGIKEIVFGGDIGEKSANQFFFDSLKNFKVNITPGNHDHFSEVRKHYTNPLLLSPNEIYYTDEDGYIRYIFLDTSFEKLSEEQFRWLSEALNTDKKIVLFMHHPVLEVRTGVDALYPLRGRDKIHALLKSSGKEIIIFCGHYHMMDERADGLIQQYISPAASYQIKKEYDTIVTDNSTFGYRIITIDRAVVTSEVVLFRN